MKGLYLLIILLISGSLMADEREFLVGKWCSHYEASGECTSIENLYRDGTYYSHGIVREWKLRYETRGTWKFENNAGCFNPEEHKYFHSETGEELTFDEERKPYCDQITDIKPNQITIKEHTNQTTVVIKRISD